MIRAAVAVVIALALGLGLGGAGRAAAQPTMNEVPAGGGARRPAQDPRDHGPDSPDRRAIYVAGGVIVLAIVFLWNRRRRAELDRESELGTREALARARAARGAPDAGAPGADADADADAATVAAAEAEATPSTDDLADADDLRAAARRSDEEPT